MNFLAHAYLSGNEPEILIGNMISDFVKGSKKFDYSPGIQSGIMHHRAIDTFTDQHPVTREAKKIFSQAYGLYAGAFMDVVYDHYLANDKNEFADRNSLKKFSSGVYQILDKYLHILPAPFQRFFPSMQGNDWLYNYKDIQGIVLSFGGLVHRAKYIYESSTANALFLENYDVLKSYYNDFFKDVKLFAAYQLTYLNHE